MIFRRRPVLRAAAAGGAGYFLGKRSRAARESARRPAAVPEQPTPSVLEQLEHLDALYRRGALTDAEFTAAKARVLHG